MENKVDPENHLFLPASRSAALLPSALSSQLQPKIMELTNPTQLGQIKLFFFVCVKIVLLRQRAVLASVTVWFVKILWLVIGASGLFWMEPLIFFSQIIFAMMKRKLTLKIIWPTLQQLSSSGGQPSTHKFNQCTHSGDSDGIGNFRNFLDALAHYGH